MSLDGTSLLDSWIAEPQGRGRATTTSSDTHEYSHSSSLKTLAEIHAFTLGAGDSVFSDILPSIEEARSEILFVTCFWARSSSLSRVASCLRNLSARAVERRAKVKVRICLSSLSLLQKLLHTRSLAGHVYPPSVWAKKLGLPPPGDLRGLDMEVKSVFIRPFSVMHPKFVVVDRKYLYLPSCNVSWENWFEGCLHISGPLVDHFVQFWKKFWANPSDRHSTLSTTTDETIHDLSRGAAAFETNYVQPSLSQPYPSTVGFKKIQLNLSEIQCAFLVSPHRSNPQFRPFPWQRAAPPPRTSLNTFLLHAFENAESKIYMQTPNVTSPPVLEALLAALKRGVDVHIVTSERLMLLEQLFTAGTTTSRCLKRLKRQFQSLQVNSQQLLHDEERGVSKALGSLTIEFFVKGISDTRVLLDPEPVQSHLKLTIVDEQAVIFGSGNMDRASWYTSQELGVACISKSLARMTTSSLESCLASRKKSDFHG